MLAALGRTYKPHALVGFSDFGSGDTNEFATWTQGRETFLSDRDVRTSPWNLPFEGSKTDRMLSPFV